MSTLADASAKLDQIISLANTITPPPSNQAEIDAVNAKADAALSAVQAAAQRVNPTPST